MSELAKSYSRPQAALHWLTAALVVSLAVVGFLMTDAAAESALRLWLSRAHVILGAATGAAVVARLALRVRSPKVAPLAMSPPRRALMTAVHAGMYLALLLVIGSGMGAALAGEWSAYLPGTGAGAPDLHGLAPREGHERFVLVLLGLVAVHVAGVVLHELRSGGALRRMIPRAAAAEAVSSTPRARP